MADNKTVGENQLLFKIKLIEEINNKVKEFEEDKWFIFYLDANDNNQIKK